MYSARSKAHEVRLHSKIDRQFFPKNAYVYPTIQRAARYKTLEVLTERLTRIDSNQLLARLRKKKS
jgi:hypothetical protein